MAATSQPPKKRVRLENESDVLTFYSGMDCVEDQSEVGMSFSVLKAVDKFKCRIQNVFGNLAKPFYKLKSYHIYLISHTTTPSTVITFWIITKIQH